MAMYSKHPISYVHTVAEGISLSTWIKNSSVNHSFRAKSEVMPFKSLVTLHWHDPLTSQILQKGFWPKKCHILKDKHILNVQNTYHLNIQQYKCKPSQDQTLLLWSHSQLKSMQTSCFPVCWPRATS